MEANKKLNLQLDYRVISIILALIVITMLVVWRPWQTAPSDDRKITVTGQATVKAEPDQYQFSPYYERDTTDEITKLNDQVLKGLKDLGVADKQIKNNASRYGSATAAYYPVPVEGKEKSTLSLTITLDNKQLVQKVQDYLVTTNPKGSISPYPSFSTTKQKQLQDQARTEAITDAKKRAQSTVGDLGAKLGKVQEIGEGQQGGGLYPLMSADRTMVAEDKAATTSLTVQPGEDEYTYSVSVTFLIR